MKKLILLLAFLFIPAVSQGTEEEKLGLFPFFTMGENIADVWINPASQKEAGADGQVVVDGDRFITEGNGKEIRFWGVNTCFSMNFPEKDDAVRYAKRMASFGINGVRLHHMDNRDIWGKNYPDVSVIDPEQLDKLDWLIYQLKLNGIYVNINLHVSRFLSKWNETFEPSGIDRHYDKGLDNFEPRMIEYQKKYARDLLTHVNPYTKMSYCEDPCVAMIEINNENSVVASWFWSELDELTPAYSVYFRKLWNEWLQKKYASTNALRDSWKSRTFPLEKNIVPDPGFDRPEEFAASQWTLENGTAKAGLWAENGVMRLNVEELGSVSWNPQFYFRDFAIQEGVPYTVKFRVRTDVKNAPKLRLNCSQNHAEWEGLGLHVSCEVGKEWKEYVFSFIPTRSDEKARFGFSGFVPGLYEFDDVSFQGGGDLGLAKEESLEDGTIQLIRRQGDVAKTTPEAKADFVSFLIDLETKYWLEMYDFIKKDLGAKAPVSGTQLNYGAHYAQAKLDYCDIHSYWNHPSFPGRPWDSGNWKLGNTSVANVLGNGPSTITHLANNRVLGKPFTVSEYNHPYPNLYGAEGFPMLSSMAGFQNWSGIFVFAWSHSKDFSTEETPSFFDIKGNSVQLVHMPACFNMFVRGDVKDANADPNAKKVVYAVTDAEEREIYGKAASGYARSLAPIGFCHENPVLTSVGVRLTDLDIPESATQGTAPFVRDDEREIPSKTVSNTGELRWNGEIKDRGFYQVDSPKTKVFTGFIQGRTMKYRDGMKIEFGKTLLDWATVSFTQTKENHWLLAATGLQKNSECVLGLYDPVEVKDTPVEEYPNLINKQITFCQKRGHAPLMCEGIPATITLPAPQGVTVKIRPLDGNAKPTGEFTAKRVSEDRVQFEISREFKTLWYEVVFE